MKYLLNCHQISTLRFSLLFTIFIFLTTDLPYLVLQNYILPTPFNFEGKVAPSIPTKKSVLSGLKSSKKLRVSSGKRKKDNSDESEEEEEDNEDSGESNKNKKKKRKTQKDY